MDDLVARLTAVWAEALGDPEFGPDDDFFARGGDSLVAVQLIAQVRRLLGANVPMRWLFEAATPAAMAQRVAHRQATPATGAIPRLARPRALHRQP